MQTFRQAAMVQNPDIKLQCDQQSGTAWMRGWECSTASPFEFCVTGGAAELAVKALFPHLKGWAEELQVPWFA